MTLDDLYGDAALAELYDLAWGDSDFDVSMYEQFARRGELPSLELGVGTGRVALHLARNGLHVVGLDASPAMLSRLEARLDPETAPRLRLVAGDMRDFDLAPQKFDLVYCAANSFQHLLTHDDQLAALRCVARHLAPGGLFVAEMRTMRAVDWSVERTPLYLRRTVDIPGTDDTLMHFQQLSPHPAHQTTTTTYIFDRVSPDGAVHRRVIDVTLRYSTLGEFALLLERAGLALRDVYGDADLSPYDDASDRMVIVASLP